MNDDELTTLAQKAMLDLWPRFYGSKVVAIATQGHVKTVARALHADAEQLLHQVDWEWLAVVLCRRLESEMNSKLEEQR